MNRQRLRYPTKAAWAAARASELRDRATALPVVSSMDWRRIRDRSHARSMLFAEAARFDRIARRLVGEDDLASTPL